MDGSYILDDVLAAFGRVAVRPRSIKIDRKGLGLPVGGHLQGIQRTGDGRLVLTSSSNTQAYLLTCDLTPDGLRGRGNRPVPMSSRPLKHAGGCQLIGGVLAAGVEDDLSRRQSEVQFWNLTPTPAQMTALAIRRVGAQNVSTAGAVGISLYRDEAVLTVASWNAETVNFYRAPANVFHGKDARFQLETTWSKSRANKAGWIDENFGAYRSVNLVTQRDGRLFLIGFNRSGSDDWMDLYSVDLAAPAPTILSKLAKKHMQCTDGCSFLYGGGMCVSSGRFDVYSVKGDSGDHRTGTTIYANQFPAT